MCIFIPFVAIYNRMSDGTGDDKLEEIMSDFDSKMTQQDEDPDESETSTNKRELSKEQLEELSKEEIAEKCNFRFGQTANGDTQHLLPANEDNTYCNVGVSDGFRTSEEPGPFNPICSNCKVSALGDGSQTRSSAQTKFDLRQWLADEIDGVQDPTRAPGGLVKPSKSDLQAIVSYIKSLKENN
jgi:hypothetical protein